MKYSKVENTENSKEYYQAFLTIVNLSKNKGYCGVQRASLFSLNSIDTGSVKIGWVKWKLV